jgi:hypothetical protein
MSAVTIDLDALARYSLTPNQYVFLWLTHARQYAALYKFGQEGPGFAYDDIRDLEVRGLILNLNRPGQYYVDFFVLTDALGSDLFEQDRDAPGLEIWNTYPVQFRDPQTGERFSLLNTDKAQFLRDYYGRVGHNPVAHRRVMVALEYAIDTNLIDLSIRQWLDSEQWTVVEELREVQ